MFFFKITVFDEILIRMTSQTAKLRNRSEKNQLKKLKFIKK